MKKKQTMEEIVLNIFLFLFLLVEWFPEMRPASFTGSDVLLYLYITLIARLSVGALKSHIYTASYRAPSVVNEFKVNSKGITAATEPYIAAALAAGKESKP